MERKKGLMLFVDVFYREKDSGIINKGIERNVCVYIYHRRLEIVHRQMNRVQSRFDDCVTRVGCEVGGGGNLAYSPLWLIMLRLQAIPTS